MKRFSFIFATYILLLTVQPVVAVAVVFFNVQTEECCSGECCKHEPEGKPAKQESMCNPFQACAYCCGYFISQPAYQVVIVQQANVLRSNIEINFASDFVANCFHPPELA